MTAHLLLLTVRKLNFSSLDSSNYDSCLLDAAHSARNLGFIFDISLFLIRCRLSKCCYSHFVNFAKSVRISILKQPHHCYLHRSLQAWLLQLTL